MELQDAVPLQSNAVDLADPAAEDLLDVSRLMSAFGGEDINQDNARDWTAV